MDEFKLIRKDSGWFHQWAPPLVICKFPLSHCCSIVQRWTTCLKRSWALQSPDCDLRSREKDHRVRASLRVMINIKVPMSTFMHEISIALTYWMNREIIIDSSHWLLSPTAFCLIPLCVPMKMLSDLLFSKSRMSSILKNCSKECVLLKTWLPVIVFCWELSKSCPKHDLISYQHH